MLKLPSITHISHASKVMLEILQARLKHYLNRELPDVQAGFRKGRGTRNQIANIRQIIERAREFQKNIYFCFIDYAKTFDCSDHNTLEKNITLTRQTVGKVMVLLFNTLSGFGITFLPRSKGL